MGVDDSRSRDFFSHYPGCCENVMYMNNAGDYMLPLFGFTVGKYGRGVHGSVELMNRRKGLSRVNGSSMGLSRIFLLTTYIFTRAGGRPNPPRSRPSHSRTLFSLSLSLSLSYSLPPSFSLILSLSLSVFSFYISLSFSLSLSRPPSPKACLDSA